MKKRKRKMNRYPEVDSKTYSKIYNKGYWAGKMFYKAKTVRYVSSLTPTTEAPNKKHISELNDLKVMNKGQRKMIANLEHQIKVLKTPKRTPIPYQVKPKDTKTTGWTMAKALRYKVKVWGD